MERLMQEKEIKNKIERAKFEGKSRIFVSPIYEENLSKITKEGNKVTHIKLKDLPIKVDMISWDEKESGCETLDVDEEQFKAILVLKQLEL